jgi:bifunctional oligoribonuclease and PAP phosphatase NrnA
VTAPAAGVGGAKPWVGEQREAVRPPAPGGAADPATPTGDTGERSLSDEADAAAAEVDLDAEFDRAAEVIRGLPRDATILLVCHVNPDGDALGSMLGFGLGLRQLGFTRVEATFPAPFEVAPVFSFLPGQDLLVSPAAAPERPDLGVSFDAASVGRVGELASALEAASTWIVLDHHASNPGFGQIRLIDPIAAATSVVAARLLDAVGIPLDRDIATNLYVALVTDTGSFRFDLTTDRVHTLAARLVAAGARPAEVALRIFDTRPFTAVQLLAAVLSRASLDRDAAGGAGLVTAYATLADLERSGLPGHVLESFMDVLRTTEEADVACLVKPAGPDRWAVSLRSRGATDVSAVAVALGGGGHRLAAGFTGYGRVTDVLDAIRAAL